MALYEPRIDSFTQYTEPGKIKVYMACGLPVITTKVPEISVDVCSKGAGLLIDFGVPELVAATKVLLRDDRAYLAARDSAIRFASEYSWEKVFDNAFAEMFRTNHWH
jgi:glycosyltransferase involved in cell wall biosynthesis